jgi:hypothetical protein
MTEKELQKLKKLIQENKKETDSFGKSVERAKESWEKIEENVSNLNASVKNLGKATSDVASMGGALGNLDLSLGAVVGTFLQLNQQFTEMNKSLGAMDGLKTQVDAVAKASAGLGLKMDAIYQSVTIANQAIFGFNELSTKQQAVIGGTINKLGKLGVDTNLAATTINTLGKSFGMSADEASKASLDLAGFSRQLGSGMTPGKVAQQFSAALPKLAAYGKGATNEFKKLAIQAKHTGMEVNDLLGIAGKFDTFEDAANNTAQLNALLGTQLNSVDMLTASEGERLDMLKENFDATGRSFDQLDRFEKKALAQAAGFEDVSKAAAFFNSSLEDINESEEEAANKDPALAAQEELNKAIQKTISFQEAFSVKVEALQKKIGGRLFPILNRFVTFLMGPAEEGKKAPIDIAMDKFDQFMTFMEKDVIKPFTDFMNTKEGEQFINNTLVPLAGAFMAIIPISTAMLAIFGPIIMMFGAIKAVILTVIGVVSAPLLGWIALIGLVGASMYLLYATVKENMDMIQLYIDENITEILGFFDALEYSIVQSFKDIGNGIIKVFAVIFDGATQIFASFGVDAQAELNAFGDWVMGWVNKIGEMFDFGFGEAMSAAIADFVQAIPGPLKEFIPDFILEANENIEPRPIKKYHQGGEMIGPGLIKNDEYVLIPPKGASAASVATPQQVKMGSGNKQQPVTVVINIDGREFVKQTVMPALNKEFKLQGIG